MTTNVGGIDRILRIVVGIAVLALFFVLEGNARYWALVGLVVTTFTFLGVNMFLSGLHSYGEL